MNCPICLETNVEIIELKPDPVLPGLWDCPKCDYIWDESLGIGSNPNR